MQEKTPLAPSLDCWFVSDLHGKKERYEKLFYRLKENPPDALFIGGDILPHGSVLSPESFHAVHREFLNHFLSIEFSRLKESLGSDYPRIFLILGNDDGRLVESKILDMVTEELWEYVHGKIKPFEKYELFGYTYVPPTPFRLKDWEKYDISHDTPPMSIPPEQGARTVPIPESEARYETIAEHLRALAGENDLSQTICLFHSPPFETALDRIASGHVGSMAIRQFIKKRQPLLTLHGHIHESARLTGNWKDSIGKTVCLSAAHDGPELAVVRFDPANLEHAQRELI